MKNKKYILIIILLLIALGFTGAYALFGPNGYTANQKAKEFLSDVIELQSTLSYYVGSSYSDAFGVYSKEELLSGISQDGEQIKDNEDNLLPNLINKENTVDYNGEVAYELNVDNAKVTLGVSTNTYEGVKLYVVDGDILKVKLESTPDWWNETLEALLLN